MQTLQGSQGKHNFVPPGFVLQVIYEYNYFSLDWMLSHNTGLLPLYRDGWRYTFVYMGGEKIEWDTPGWNKERGMVAVD